MASADFKPEPFTEPQAFIWSIEQAAHSPHHQWFNGVQYAVGRGEFVTSLHAMMTAFGWSEKRVRGFRDRMVKAGKWAKRGASLGAKAPQLITVCRYELFQAPARKKGEAEDEAKGEARAKEGRSEGEEQKEWQSNSDELERSAAAPAPALPYAEAVTVWSDAAAIKGWKPLNPDLTDKRRTGLRTILKVHGLDGWVAALQRALDSEVLGGPDPPAWFNFTFVCNPENFVKLKDGNYDRNFSRPTANSNGSNAWREARAAIRELHPAPGN